MSEDESDEVGGIIAGCATQGGLNRTVVRHARVTALLQCHALRQAGRTDKDVCDFYAAWVEAAIKEFGRFPTGGRTTH